MHGAASAPSRIAVCKGGASCACGGRRSAGLRRVVRLPLGLSGPAKRRSTPPTRPCLRPDLTIPERERGTAGACPGRGGRRARPGHAHRSHPAPAGKMGALSSPGRPRGKNSPPARRSMGVRPGAPSSDLSPPGRGPPIAIQPMAVPAERFSKRPLASLAEMTEAEPARAAPARWPAHRAYHLRARAWAGSRFSASICLASPPLLPAPLALAADDSRSAVSPGTAHSGGAGGGLGIRATAVVDQEADGARWI